MTSPPLATRREQLRALDENILRALNARARFPRQPHPRWPATETRLPPPPLTEILLALSPAGTADPAPAAENRALIQALLARQQLAAEIADAKTRAHPADFRAALETGDREKLPALLADLPAELHQLEFIRATAAEIAPQLPGALAILLWREHLIPWARQSEVAHLLEP